MDLLKKLRKTPFHPQWFAFLREESNLRSSCASLYGTVLDIGCADGKPGRYLPDGTDYIGLDYFDTATGWYKTRPSVFGDAQQLPFADEIVDHILLLDVLEHIPDPDRCLAEIFRVLKTGGTVTIQVPFIYPIHDAPLDFHRWTRFGLRRAAERAGFVVQQEIATGHPAETAALASNIAISKTVLNWIAARNPLLFIAVFLPPLILARNCLAWLIAALSRGEDMMPYSYRVIWTKS